VHNCLLLHGQWQTVSCDEWWNKAYQNESWIRIWRKRVCKSLGFWTCKKLPKSDNNIRIL